MGWINSAIQFLQKVLLFSKSFAILGVLAAMFNYCVIKTIPSNAKSHEEQDGYKQYFVGQTMAKLQAVFHLQVAKNTENQRFTFPVSFDDQDYQNRNFMMINILVILSL